MDLHYAIKNSIHDVQATWRTGTHLLYLQSGVSLASGMIAILILCGLSRTRGRLRILGVIGWIAAVCFSVWMIFRIRHVTLPSLSPNFQVMTGSLDWSAWICLIAMALTLGWIAIWFFNSRVIGPTVQLDSVRLARFSIAPSAVAAFSAMYLIAGLYYSVVGFQTGRSNWFRDLPYGSALRLLDAFRTVPLCILPFSCMLFLVATNEHRRRKSLISGSPRVMIVNQISGRSLVAFWLALSASLLILAETTGQFANASLFVTDRFSIFDLLQQFASFWFSSHLDYFGIRLDYFGELAVLLLALFPLWWLLSAGWHRLKKDSADIKKPTTP